MMTTTRLYASTRALPAIAAALALSSTAAFAQEAQPTTAAPATTVQPAPEAPAPETDTTAPATDATTPAPATDTSTPATTTTAKQSAKRTVRTTRISAAKPGPIAARTVTRTVAKRAAVPATATAPVQTAAAAPPAPQSAVAPVVPLNAKPAPTNTQPSKSIDNDTMEIAGGGALALLALGGTAAMLMGRRRRRKEQDWADEQTMAYAPTETAAAPEHEPVVHQEASAAAASAFAWGDQAQADAPARSSDLTADEDDRQPGESWVDRAYRGPSANNPSVSLRTRLKRAAFFDKREREAAAGLAEPVDASAGLPDAMIEEQERELA
jgi:hypothetical protein